jgi:hypothetical protein
MKTAIYRYVIPISVGAILIVVFVFPTIRFVYWVGSTNLELKFQILDADTESAIANAHVNVLHEETTFSKQISVPFELSTNEQGIATLLCENCRCAGKEGGWGPTRPNSFGMYLPGWYLDVSAPGYRNSEPFFLSDFGQQIQRGEHVATLLIVVKLEKEK